MFGVIFCALGPNVVEEVSLNTGSKVNGFFLAPVPPFVFDKRATSMSSGPVAPCSHLNDFMNPGSGLSNKQQDHLVPLEGGVSDHVINGFAHTLMHSFWFQHHLGFPNLPAPLAKLVCGKSTFG